MEYAIASTWKGQRPVRGRNRLKPQNSHYGRNPSTDFRPLSSYPNIRHRLSLGCWYKGALLDLQDIALVVSA